MQEYEAWLLPPKRLLQEEKCDAFVLLSDVNGVAKAPLTTVLGAEDGEALALDIASLPHLAIAGTTGSGKSTLLRTILTSLLTVSTPDDLKLVLVDMDGELDILRGLPHLKEEPLDDTVEAIRALEEMATEIDRRRELFHEHETYSITEFNALGVEHIPRMLCVVDEFAAMISADKKRVEAAITHIGRRGRKYGIHLILATQDPYADILTKSIRSVVPGRLALAVNDATASRVILGVRGAELLHGDGDALLKDGKTRELRHFQTAWVAREVLEGIVEHWRKQARPESPETVSPELTVTPRLGLRRRGRARWLAAGIALGIGVATLHGIPIHLSGAPACPPRTQEYPTGLSDLCVYPNNEVFCTIWASGFTPNPGENRVNHVYTTTPPEGVWCDNAHDNAQ